MPVNLLLLFILLVSYLSSCCATFIETTKEMLRFPNSERTLDVGNECILENSQILRTAENLQLGLYLG